MWLKGNRLGQLLGNKKHLVSALKANIKSEVVETRSLAAFGSDACPGDCVGVWVGTSYFKHICFGANAIVFLGISPLFDTQLKYELQFIAARDIHKGEVISFSHVPAPRGVEEDNVIRAQIEGFSKSPCTSSLISCYRVLISFFLSGMCRTCGELRGQLGDLYSYDSNRHVLVRKPTQLIKQSKKSKKSKKSIIAVTPTIERSPDIELAMIMSRRPLMGSVPTVSEMSAAHKFCRLHFNNLYNLASFTYDKQNFALAMQILTFAREITFPQLGLTEAFIGSKSLMARFCDSFFHVIKHEKTPGVLLSWFAAQSHSLMMT
jgi:hypothetical protein